MTEFAQKGYKAASTNAIIEKAGIGKGMLFYYFGSKEELFKFICDYAIEYMNSNYFMQVDELIADSKGDIFTRYRMLSRLKHKAVTENPELFSFFEGTITRDYAALFIEGANRYNELRDYVIEKLYDNCDESLFRDGLDTAKCVRYIKWLFDGYERDLKERFNRPDAVKQVNIKSEWDRYEEFIEDLRQIFYRHSAKPQGERTDENE